MLRKLLHSATARLVPASAEPLPVILHVGAHKTGTSLIQKFLRDNKKLFLRHGVSAISRASTDVLIGYGSKSILGANTEGLRKEIETHRKSAPRVILSHENSLGRPFIQGRNQLYPNAKRTSERLSAALEGIPVKVILYIRSQPDFFESYYLQSIHEGAYHTFGCYRQKHENVDLSWAPIARSLADAFGRENLIIRSFDQDISDGQAGFLRGFFSSFMTSQEISFSDFEYKPRRNPSLGDKGLEIALAANRHLETRSERKAMRSFLQDNFSNKDYPRPKLYDPDEAESIRLKYERENAKILADEY